MTAISAASQFLEIMLLDRVAQGDFLSTAQLQLEAENNDRRQQIVAIGTLIAFLISGVASLVWTHQAAVNSRDFVLAPPSISPGWAVGWYFVPIANLWMPYRAMVEVAQRSQPVTTVTPYLALGWWWILWISTSIGGRALLRLARQADEIESLTNLAWASVALDLVTIPLILVYMRIIRLVTSMQVRRDSDRD
jgi:uncharacterized membrane protein